MKYVDAYNYLKSIENYTDPEIIVDEHTVLKNFSFESKYRFILPGGLGNGDDYEYIPSEEGNLKYEPDIIQEMLNKKDAEIMENIKFRYHILSNRSKEKSKGIIFMFHGFNEKSWHKYLPWAKYLVENTGKCVVMFPIAFHMNRAPQEWTNARDMHSISKQRAIRHTNVINSSLSNVAISTRLHNRPQRFVWSGLQTYYDMMDLIEEIKADKHPAIHPDATMDIFAYSIGTFLAQIIMMTNKNNYFSESKLASFCGGAVFNRLSPVSKFILDSEANVSLYSYVVEHLDSHMKRDETLRHYLGEAHPEGLNFRSMLSYKIFTKEREDLFRAMSDRIYVVTLMDDTVVPPYEIINTVQGTKRDIPIRVDIEDLPYKYKHEDPFPSRAVNPEEVGREFKRIFEPIANFLK